MCADVVPLASGEMVTMYSLLNLLLDYLRAEEPAAPLTVPSRSYQSGSRFSSNSSVPGVGPERRRVFLLAGHLCDILSLDRFQSTQPPGTHTCARQRKYRRAHNPTITTSCSEKAARLFLDPLLLWKIYPWHKKDRSEDAVQMLQQSLRCLRRERWASFFAYLTNVQRFYIYITIRTIIFMCRI